MNERKSVKKSILAMIVLILLAILIEIFAFNIRAFQTCGYEEKNLDDFYDVELVGGVFDSDGDIVMNKDADYVTLNITGFGYPLNNIRLDAECLSEVKDSECQEKVCVVECSAFDDALFEMIGTDGKSYLQNGAVMTVRADIIHDIENSHYLFLNPFGNTHKLQIVLYPKSGDLSIIRIHELTFNAVKPVRIYPARTMVIFLVLLIIYYSLANLDLWQTDCIGRKKWKTVLIAGTFVVFAVFTSFWMISDKAIWTEGFSPYSALAKAISDGRLYVGEASDTVISTEGRPVFWRGDSTEVMFDYAYYDGKYYVYFGLLPCLVFYLPYHLITGGDMPNALPGLLLRLMTVALVGRLIWNIIRRYYRKTPLALFLLMWWGTVCGMYIPVLMTEMIMFYDVPILSGLVLTLAGACFWTGMDSFGGRNTVMKATFGSVCMAAVSLCRPTMLLYGFVILAFIIWYRRDEIKCLAHKELVSYGGSVVIPYVFFAIICMIYNALRFGSPLDFGSSYNSTTYPIEGASLFIPYVAVRAAYEYLLKPPYINFGFPFTKFTVWEKVRVAGNIMVVDMFDGGILSANPFSWGLALIAHYRTKLRQKNLLWPMVSSIAISLFLMVYGVVYTSSVYTRYTLEFSPVILVCGCIMIMEIYEDIAMLDSCLVKKVLRVVVTLALMFSLGWGGIQLCCAETGSAGMAVGNPELWYTLKYGFRIF